MKITILNGDLETKKSDFSDYIEELVKQFQVNNHIVDVFHLKKMELSYCHGCWNCWWKNPGLCSTKDDAEIIFKSYINSDFVIFASPLYVGFTSSSLKKISDRLIVLLHPYIEIRNKESHHTKRYKNYPDFGLLIKEEDDTDKEDIQILNDIYDRFAINFHCEKRYLKSVNLNTEKEIVNASCNI